MLPVCVQAIHVPDLEEAVRFYAAALGYEVKERYGPCIAQLRTGATTLVVQQIEPGAEPVVPGTILCFQTEDIRASMQKVVEAGGRLVHAQPQRCPVGDFVLFRDRAGVMFELLQFDKA